MLLGPLFLLLAAFLIWKGFGLVRVLGWLLLLLVAYYKFSWISPLYVIRGSDYVQEFKLHEVPFGSSPSVRWMESSHHLLLVPDERVVFHPEPPEYNHVLVIDLETRKSHWQPKATVNLDETIPIKYLDTDSSSKVGPRNESSFVGFSLPIPFYKIPWVFQEISGWDWEKTYFGWWRDIMRDSESGHALVELNQIVLNSRLELTGSASAWVMEGKFLIVEPLVYIDNRVFVLGPFNTSQNTQSENN